MPRLSFFLCGYPPSFRFVSPTTTIIHSSLALAIARLFVCAVVALVPAMAQKVVPGSYQGERLLAIVPMTGAGTLQDPRRPLFAPFELPAVAPTARVVTAADVKPENRESILAFRYEVSSDKRFALVEFVAADTRAFDALRKSGRADVRVFERNRTNKDEIEREFRRYKPDFSLDRFLAGGAR